MNTVGQFRLHMVAAGTAVSDSLTPSDDTDLEGSWIEKASGRDFGYVAPVDTVSHLKTCLNLGDRHLVMGVLSNTTFNTVLTVCWSRVESPLSISLVLRLKGFCRIDSQF
jgi:hypothetical protein